MTTRVRRGVLDDRTSACAVWMALAVLTVLGMTLGAQLRIPAPGTAVPFTLQSLALVLIGLTLPRVPAAAGMAAYLALGGAGVPVFQAGSAGFLGPTGGYLLGFLPAVVVMSTLRGRGCAGLIRLHVAGAAGLAIVLLCGVSWLSAWEGRFAFSTGLQPFVVKAMIEVSLAAWMVHAGRGVRIGRRRLSG
ncbi:MAG: biotin transporter BioY [Phycisphaerae bacterium]|nr:biotin transporter BioY [Phycisphaerae bacterium]